MPKSNLYILLSDTVKEEKHPLKENEKVSKLLDKINLYLKKEYTGKYKFNLCSEENGIKPDELKLSPKKKRKIKTRWLEFNSQLSEIQREYECFLQNSKKK